jgi:uncharacterized protein
MAMDRNGLDILSRTECLELIRSRPIGRVAVSAHALPVILPVNYRLLGDAVVFATGVGSKSLSVEHETVVAFEVDDFDVATRSGWSVLIVDIARELDERDDDWEAARGLDLHPWVGHHAKYLIKLPTDRISGRRLSGRPAAVRAHTATVVR